MKVAYTADALGDVAKILSFVAKQSPEHAANIAALIDIAGKALAVFPRAARHDQETGVFERPIPGLPFIMIYTVSNELIEVIAIFHTSRNPAKKRRA